MAEHIVIGSEESPYSVKVRAYFRYKGIPHQWRDRGEAQELFARHARLPLVPLVVTPDERGLQDSTPIIEALEAAHPAPSIDPPETAARFVSALLEEFADEWGNKWMFHMRWAREVDQVTVSERFAAGAAARGGGSPTPEQLQAAAKRIRDRMVPRVWFVGANEVTAPQIEASLADALEMLDAHLARRPYLFGGRPALADFGLWGQLYECGRDPTAGALVAQAANVALWVGRMENPAHAGDFEPWAALAPTLTPLLRDQVAGLFLPWSVANAAALAAGQDEFDVTLKGRRWTQKPQKYHARSLAALKAKYTACQGDATLDALLDATGCAAPLR